MGSLIWVRSFGPGNWNFGFGLWIRLVRYGVVGLEFRVLSHCCPVKVCKGEKKEASE